MKEPHRRKEVAIHPGSESCGVVREGGVEALTGVRAGEVLSREITVLGCRRRGPRRKAALGGRYRESDTELHAVEDPLHARRLHAREPGDLTITRRGWPGGSCGEGLWP